MTLFNFSVLCIKSSVYIDDGFSGTNFDRPNFQRMIDDVESGKVNCIIVKDLSRFGRRKFRVEQYTEDYFPKKGVRFIAVTDDVDSARGENEITTFKNWANEYYANTSFCSMHYIRYDALYQAVLGDLRKWIAAAEQDEEALLDYLTNSESDNFQRSHKRLVSDIAKAKKRLTELDSLIIRLHEERLQDKITESNFDMMLVKWQNEQEEQRAALDTKQQELQEQKQNTDNSRKWIDMLKQFTDPQELTIPMLNTLIDKIVIHSATTDEDGKRSQEIEIYYKFVGKIE